jgi:ABC-type transporter Mla maintaining outer membrane lipid asymmetry ATPase subunit MlaF
MPQEIRHLAGPSTTASAVEDARLAAASAKLSGGMSKRIAGERATMYPASA